MGKRTKKLILSQSDLDQAVDWAEQQYDSRSHECSNAEHAHNLANEITNAAQQEFGLSVEDRDELRQRAIGWAAEEFGELETEEDHQREAYDDAMREIEDGDCVTINERDEVYFGNELLGQIGEDENDDFTWNEVWGVIEAEMNRRGWYPGIYMVNDHGNITQYSVAGTVLNSWV